MVRGFGRSVLLKMIDGLGRLWLPFSLVALGCEGALVYYSIGYCCNSTVFYEVIVMLVISMVLTWIRIAKIVKQGILERSTEYLIALVGGDNEIYSFVTA